MEGTNGGASPLFAVNAPLGNSIYTKLEVGGNDCISLDNLIFT